MALAYEYAPHRPELRYVFKDWSPHAEVWGGREGHPIPEGLCVTEVIVKPQYIGGRMVPGFPHAMFVIEGVPLG